MTQRLKLNVAPPADWLLTSVFVIFYLVQLAHHEMWRDELNAFGMAAGSSSLSSLLHLVRYEGHPWLWYVMLWLVSRVTFSAVALKVVQGTIGVAILALIGLKSPFRRYEKILLLAGYFFSFEYTVMSRMYGLVVLLALLYVRRRASTPDGVVGGAVLLGLMACADLTGMLLSFALIAEYCWSAWRERHEDLLPRGPRRLWLAVGVYLSLLLSAGLSMLPATDISRDSTAELFFDVFSVKRLAVIVTSYMVKPFTPNVTNKPGHYWDVSAGGHQVLFAIGVPLVVLAYWWVLRRKPNLLVLVGTACLLLVAMGHLLYKGSERQFGMTFIAFLLALWLLRAARQPVAWPAQVLLAASVLGGVITAAGTWSHPFSEAAATAAWLRTNGRGDTLLVTQHSMLATSVGVLMEQPMYQADCDRVSRYYLFDQECPLSKRYMLPGRLARAKEIAGSRSVTFVATEPLSPKELDAVAKAGLQVRPLTAMVGAEVGGEDFYLYDMHP